MATTTEDELIRLVDADRDHVIRLSHRVHADPELGIEERQRV